MLRGLGDVGAHSGTAREDGDVKLGSLKNGRDGQLVLVSRDLSRAVPIDCDGVRTLQHALDNWAVVAPELRSLAHGLESARAVGLSRPPWNEFAAPLPRAFQWLDGSAYLNHVALVRRARGSQMPPSFETSPVMYQGSSDTFLGPADDLVLPDEAWGADFEAEVAVIVGDVPLGCTREQAAAAIQLLVLVNDVSLRNLIPDELAKGFGFLHGKPSSAFAPVAVTPDELGKAWDGSRLHLPVSVYLNGDRFGGPNAAADMHFDFPDLLVHAAKTRALSAGTILGAGTVSNRDPDTGACCIAERRAREIIAHGEWKTPYLRYGDVVRIDVRDDEDASVFGPIEQRVVAVTRGTRN